MKLEPIKEYTAVVSVEWSTSFEAGSKEDFIPQHIPLSSTKESNMPEDGHR